MSEKSHQIFLYYLIIFYNDVENHQLHTVAVIKMRKGY